MDHHGCADDILRIWITKGSFILFLKEKIYFYGMRKIKNHIPDPDFFKGMKIKRVGSWRSRRRPERVVSKEDRWRWIWSKHIKNYYVVKAMHTSWKLHGLRVLKITFHVTRQVGREHFPFKKKSVSRHKVTFIEGKQGTYIKKTVHHITRMKVILLSESWETQENLRAGIA